MKSIKKLKKYGTAAATSALLVGATLTGAAAASHGGSSGTTGTLGDYPHPFVDEDGAIQSSIVVGEDAATADVVGAIDIAGSLSQAAYTETTVSSGDGATGTVNGANLDKQVIGTSVSSSIDKSDADYFTRKTVQDDDGDDVFVTESATISPSGSNNVASLVNGTTTELTVGTGAVEYQASYSPGMTVNDTIYMLGNEYELTSVAGDEIDLGSTQEATGLQIDETFTHGPYTVKVEGANSDSNEVLVQVSEDGSSVKTANLQSGEEVSVDDGNFVVRADTVFYSTSNQQWSISMSSTYTDTTLTEGEDAPFDADYEVASASNSGIATTTPAGGVQHVTGIKLVNDVATKADPDADDEDETARIEVGETFQGPLDYFGVTNTGLTDEAMTDIEFASDAEVTFTGVNNQEHTITTDEMQADGVIDYNSGNVADEEDTYMGLPGPDTGNDNQISEETGSNYDYYPVKVTSVSTDNSEVSAVTLEYNEFKRTIEADSSEAGTKTVPTGYGFSVYVDFDPSGATADDAVVGTATANTGAAPQATTQHGGLLTFHENVAADGITPNVPVDNGGSSDNIDAIMLHEDAGSPSAQDGEEVVVAFENEDATSTEQFNDASPGEIGAVVFDTPASTRNGVTLGDVKDGESSITDFGSEVDMSSSTSTEIAYPDEQRYQTVAFGEYSESGSSGEGVTSMEPYYGDTFPSVGHLDTDENIGQVKQNDNLILVGGPAINDLTQQLASENMTMTANEWQTGGYEGTSILQLTEGFDGEGGNKALVVAGHAAEDTRTAAEFLANYGDHQDALEGQEKVEISTETGQVVE